MLAGKVIVVGVTGSIAAYKTADLVSQLVKQEAEVEVILTRGARAFIAPLTLAALAGRPARTDWLEDASGPAMTHIELAGRADALVIAPATAHTIARLALGLADDLLTATALATRAPVLVVPAMNTQMYLHPATQDNLRRLKELGYHVVEPESGRLACGVTGPGRLPATEAILAAISHLLARGRELEGRTILVTAGGTREPFDPIRFISNRSSGKMGYALAAEALARGAEVILVSAPVSMEPPPGVKLVPIETAQEMHDVVMEYFPHVDAVIKAAAVADYRPVEVAGQKIKKQTGRWVVELEPTPDILRELGRQKTRQVLVGFAAETEELEEHGREKLQEKNLDLIVANDVTRSGAGFGADTNIVTLIFADGRVEALPKLSKREVAERILDAVIKLLQEE